MSIDSSGVSARTRASRHRGVRVDAFFPPGSPRPSYGRRHQQVHRVPASRGRSDVTVNRYVEVALTRLPEGMRQRVQEDREEWTFAA